MPPTWLAGAFRRSLDLWPAAPAEVGTDVVWQFTRELSGPSEGP
jgi:hypothetical protein